MAERLRKQAAPLVRVVLEKAQHFVTKHWPDLGMKDQLR